jgi:hypothetical protein
MPTTRNYLNFLYVNVAFFIQIAIILNLSIENEYIEIKKWPFYRSNNNTNIINDKKCI